MSHERQQLREAIKAALVGTGPDYNTSAGARVYETRKKGWLEGELPAISVYTEQESVDPSSVLTAPRELKRTVQIAIEGAVYASDNVDDELDDLALEIENAMDADLNFGATAEDSVMVSTDMAIDMSGKRPLGLIRIVYSMVYRNIVPRTNPELDDAFTLDIRFSTVDGDATIHASNQAHNVVDLEE